MKDIFQDRYLEHQERKQKYECLEDYKHDKGQLLTLINIMDKRRSQRIFNDEEISQNEIDLINFSIINSPSSCNRQAVYLKEVEPSFIEEHFRGANNWAKNGKKRVYDNG